MHVSKADVWVRLQQLLLHLCYLEGAIGAEMSDDNDETSKKNNWMSGEWEDYAIEEENNEDEEATVRRSKSKARLYQKVLATHALVTLAVAILLELYQGCINVQFATANVKTLKMLNDAF